MYKNATYKEKFRDLQEWLPLIIESVKKDLKNEHLRKDFQFVKKFLSSKNVQKVTTDELVQAYYQAIQEEEKGDELAEFITSRWLLKNSELYDFFEQKLSRLSPDFTTIEEIDPTQAQTLIDASIHQFGAPHTYLFAVLNSVVFTKEKFESLRQQAQKQHQQQIERQQHSLAQLSADQLRKGFEREIARLTDKYEKKLAGLEKKYHHDVEGLKKQISQLQRKLQGKATA